MLENIKKHRIVLGQLLNDCHSCTSLNQLEDQFDRLRYCITQCHHWLKIQEQRELIEEEQFRIRNTKNLLPASAKSNKLDPASKKIGQNLKALRIKNNFSQDQVARIMGYTLSLISLHERGIRQIPQKHLTKYAQFYEVPIEEIIGVDHRENRKFG